MKRKIIVFLLILTTLTIFWSCSGRRNQSAISGIRTYLDYIDTDKRFGVEYGDIYIDLAESLFQAHNVVEALTVADLISSLRSGRIDAVLVGHDYISQIITSGTQANFEFLWVPSEVFLKQASFVFHTEDLRNRYNLWFETIVKDGTFQQITDRWLSGVLPNFEDIPRYEFTGENGILRIVDTGNYPPLSYLDPQGNPVGFGTEIMHLFAQHVGMIPETAFMPYEAIIPHIIAGRADVSAATKSLDDDFSNDVFFTTPAITTRAVLIVPSGINLGLSMNDFISRQIAVINDRFTISTAKLFGAKPKIYHSSLEAIDDVRSMRIFGYMEPISILRAVLSVYSDDIFDIITVPKEINKLTPSIISMEQGLIDSFNNFLSEIETTGILTKMHEFWFNIDFSNEVPAIPTILQNNTNTNLPAIKVALCSDSRPYMFYDNAGNYSGFCVELSIRFGQYIGRTVQFVEIHYDDMLSAVESRQVDIALDRSGAIVDKASNVLFSNSYYEEPFGIMILKQVHNVGLEKDYTSFIGSRIGLSLGTVFVPIAENFLRANLVSYTTYSAGIEDLRRRRVDGYITDLVTLNLYASLPENNDLVVYPIPSHVFELPMGAFSSDIDLINRFNQFFHELSRTNTIKEMQDRWLGTEINLDYEHPIPSSNGRNGVLRVATNGEKPPYSFIGSSGRYNGYSIELARLFAYHEDMAIRFIDLEFSALIPFVAAGRADIGIANVSITDERRRLISFSDPIWYDTGGIIALKSDIDEIDENTFLRTEFFGTRIGVMSETRFDNFVVETIRAIPSYYDDFNLATIDFETGRLSGFMMYKSLAESLNRITNYRFDIHVLEPAELFYVHTHAIANNQNIVDRFNSFLATIKAESTYLDIQSRWFSFRGNLETNLPEINTNGLNGTLTVATSGTTRPYSFYNVNGDLVGFCIEMITRFAAQEGLNLEFAIIPVKDIFNYVTEGKADIGIDLLQAQDQWVERIIYTNPIYEGETAIITLVNPPEPKLIKFITLKEKIKEGIHLNFLTDNRWKLIVDGLRVTMIIAIMAHIIGTFLGFFVNFLTNRKFWLLRWIGKGYYEFLQRTPKVVILLISFYIFFAKTTLTNIQIAIIAFAMISSVEVAKVIKKASEKINFAEIEAARCLGFSKFQAYYNVVFQQIVKLGLEDYLKSFIYILEATAIVGYIAINDLTRAGEIIRSRTFDAFFPLLSVTIIYLIVISILIWIFKKISKAYHRSGDLRSPS